MLFTAEKQRTSSPAHQSESAQPHGNISVLIPENTVYRWRGNGPCDESRISAEEGASNSGPGPRADLQESRMKPSFI